jgi:Tol biopolymer transport system component
LPEILGLNSSPWDLYTSSPDGSNPKKILSSINDPGKIKWSPKEKIIAFAGKFSGVMGIWLVDPAQSKVTRIWSTGGDFDWSPDGSKIVVLDQQTDKDGKITSQNISIISIK